MLGMHSFSNWPEFLYTPASPGLIIYVNRYVTASDNDLGGANNTAPAGTITASDIPYDFTLLGSGKVVATVPGEAGAILTW